VAVKRSSFKGVKKVILVDDELASGGELIVISTRSSAIADGPRNALC